MKSVIKKQNVQTAPPGPSRKQPPEVAAASSSKESCPPPGVRLVRLDGRVSAIELTCRCGDVSVLELEYDDDATGTNEVTQ